MKDIKDVLRSLRWDRVSKPATIINDVTVNHSLGRTYEDMLDTFVDSGFKPQRTNFDVFRGEFVIDEVKPALDAFHRTGGPTRIIACITDIGFDLNDPDHTYLNFICTDIDIDSEECDHIGKGFWVVDSKRLGIEECMKFYPEEASEHGFAHRDNRSIQFFSKEESDRLVEEITLGLALEGL